MARPERERGGLRPNYELESTFEEFLKPKPNDAHLMAESAIWWSSIEPKFHQFKRFNYELGVIGQAATATDS
jgi:hypothetical protein